MIAKARLLRHLADGGGMVPRSGLVVKGVHPRTLDNTLTLLQEEGAVERCIRLTEAGRRELEKLDLSKRAQRRASDARRKPQPPPALYAEPDPKVQEDAEIETIRQEAIQARALILE